MYVDNPKATPKERLKHKSLLGSTPKFQVVAGATKWKKDCIQFLGLKKKVHNPVTMEEFF
jgi:hypothetical protein